MEDGSSKVDSSKKGGYGGNLTAAQNGYPSTSLYEGLGATSGSISPTNYMFYVASDGVTRSVPSSEKGNFGKGGSVDFDGAGAGGGGYYGGGAAHDENAGGGGGLSYVYQNIKRYKGGYYFPLNSLVLAAYDIDTLTDINYLIYNGNWDGITTNTSSIESKNGGTTMPNPLSYTGTSTMTGNHSNGYARIKKID